MIVKRGLVEADFGEGLDLKIEGAWPSERKETRAEEEEGPKQKVGQAKRSSDEIKFPPIYLKEKVKIR